MVSYHFRIVSTAIVWYNSCQSRKHMEALQPYNSVVMSDILNFIHGFICVVACVCVRLFG
jgi:hypothetical protein